MEILLRLQCCSRRHPAQHFQPHALREDFRRNYKENSQTKTKLTSGCEAMRSCRIVAWVNWRRAQKVLRRIMIKPAIRVPD